MPWGGNKKIEMQFMGLLGAMPAKEKGLKKHIRN